MNFITLQFHDPNDTIHLWFTVIHLTCALLLDDKIKPHSVQTRKSVNFQQIEFTQNPVYFGQNLVDFQTANRFHSNPMHWFHWNLSQISLEIQQISVKSITQNPTDFTQNPMDFSQNRMKNSRFPVQSVTPMRNSTRNERPLACQVNSSGMNVIKTLSGHLMCKSWTTFLSVSVKNWTQ